MEAFRVRKYILTMMVLIGSLTGLWDGAIRAQEPPSTAEKETAATNFLQRGWYAERGVELPRPFGIGVNAIFMERDISVQFGGRLSLHRRVDLMAEVGSNFDDSRMLVLSATVRF